MHMRKITKAFCVALSMMMLVNVAGFDVLASETDGTVEAGADAAGTQGGSDAVQGDTPNGEDSSDDKQENDGKEPQAPSENPDTPDGDNTDKSGSGIETPDVSGVDNGKEPADEPKVPEEGVQPEQTVAEPEAPVEALEAVKAQEITSLTAKPVAGSKEQMEITWQAAQGRTYTLVVKDGNNEVLNRSGLTSGKEIVTVTPGKRYDITVTEDIEDDLGTDTIPAILLLSPSVKVTADDSSVKLSWEAVAGADSYAVIYGGKTETATGTSHIIKNPADVSKFEVKAVCTLKDADGREYPYESAAGAAALEKKPAQVTDLSGIDGDKSAILTWSKAARAESYIVYRYNASSKKWEAVKKGVTGLTYTDKNLSAGKKYQYRVAAVNNGGRGELSDKITISVKKTPGTKVRTIGYKATVKSRAPLFTSKSSKKRVKYLKKGTKVTTIDYGRARYQIKLSNGKTYWISKDRLTFRASVWTKKDYSTKVKEDFVNKKGYKSKTKYLIWISQYTQRVIIYKGSKKHWKMIRSCRCATGTHNFKTPKGIFKIFRKEKGWFYKSTYEKPVVRFKSRNAFHSRIHNYKGGYADATIGRPKSKGCVRLYDEDIQFIYKKCPIGTTVVSH